MSSLVKSIHQFTAKQRLHIVIRGAVQGVGFRPFIYRLATELDLVGWVHNSAQGVEIEIEGYQSQLDLFLHRIENEQPPRSHIQRLNSSLLEPVGYSTFEIRASVAGDKTAIVLPDMATCPDCLTEIFNPANRRYRYPFTNCTNCGPRFSIIEALPYDRPNTTMRSFRMCCHCQTEYENPGDRRFHAQPNACPLCGLHLELWNPVGETLASHDNALRMTADAIRQGKIVAIKGLGGFHLIVDACNEKAVQRLRQVKNRAAKPFALMYPSLELIKAHCEVSELEDQLLRSPAAPIVLLKLKNTLHPTPHNVRLRRSAIAQSSRAHAEAPHSFVAPNNPYLGIMLPYTPLHHLLMEDLGFPVVATSGNLADEPICTDEQEAIQRLGKMADVLLVHNRSIARPIDDSVVRVISDQETILRRARGYAPLPISIDSKLKISPTKTLHEQNLKLKILAVGAHLKNTIAFSMDQQAFLSQHIGDLETVLAYEAFQNTIACFQEIYELHPTAIACDLHPDYRSTQFAHQLANQLEIPVIPVQHHYAHVLSCMAEHQLEGSALGIAWDGTGYGLDSTIWGGEFLHITDTTFQRVAHLRSFPLPGGDKAVKEPKRSAIGLLYELFGDGLFEMERLNPLQAFTSQELKIMKTMLNKRFNAPITSSAGRLFDAIAAIIGLRQSLQFEGQAAMELEFAIEAFETDEYYPFEILKPTNITQPITIDWAAMVKTILTEVNVGLSIKQLSARFHNTLVEMVVAIAHQVGEERVILTGGCYQNKYLAERAIQRLRAEGFCPYRHQRIPSNDGGIALGQIMAALRELSGGKVPCV
jgi:hydrogenase maturation protein HypF